MGGGKISGLKKRKAKGHTGIPMEHEEEMGALKERNGKTWKPRERFVLL